MTARLRAAWLSVVAAAALNAVGMPLEGMIAQTVPGVPLWPAVASTATGLALLGLLLLCRRLSLRQLSLIYLLNAAAVASVFYVAAPYYIAGLKDWVPFQGNKLGCIVTALLAPSLPAGLVGIMFHCGAALVQFARLGTEASQQLGYGEPFATVIFAVAGVVTLFFRFARVRFEERLVHAQAEAAAMKRLATACLHIRDLMNTPLQTIECSLALLQAQETSARDAAVYGAIDRAFESMHALSRLLSEHEAAVNWEASGTSFDAERSLKGLLSGITPAHASGVGEPT